MTEQSSIPVEAQAVPDQPVATDEDDRSPEERLNPCPKCGGKPVIDEWFRADSARMVQARCSKCQHTGSEFHATQGDLSLIKEWNAAPLFTRPTPAAADLHQQIHSDHLAGDDAGQDFRARCALSTVGDLTLEEWRECALQLTTDLAATEAQCLALKRAQGTPADLTAYLDEDATKLLRDFIGTDDEPPPLTFKSGQGHDGFGLYVWLSEYPDEGAIRIDTISNVAQPSIAKAPTEVLPVRMTAK